MFRSRNEWFAHELQNHRREWACQFCQLPPFSTVSAFTKHTKSVHPGVLAGSSLDALVLQSEEPIDKISSKACQLCNDWETDLIRKQANLPESLASPKDYLEIAYSKPKLFRRHLGRHMEQLALFALPSHDTEELEDDSSVEEKQEVRPGELQKQTLEDESEDEDGEDEPEQIVEQTLPRSESGTPAVPTSALREIRALSSRFHTSSLPSCRRYVTTPPSDQETKELQHRKLSEAVLTEIILKLDAVETEGDNEARLARRSLVKEVQGVLREMDQVLATNDLLETLDIDIRRPHPPSEASEGSSRDDTISPLAQSASIPSHSYDRLKQQTGLPATTVETPATETQLTSNNIW